MKLRPVLELLRKDPTVEFVKEMPIILRRNQIEIDDNARKIKPENEVCDVCDLYNRVLFGNSRMNELGRINIDDTT